MEDNWQTMYRQSINIGDQLKYLQTINKQGKTIDKPHTNKQSTKIGDTIDRPHEDNWQTMKDKRQTRYKQ